MTTSPDEKAFPGIEQATVVLTEDHDIVRYAVKSLLEKSGHYKVVGEAENAESTIDLLEKHRPQLAILDLGLPGRSGLETIYQIKERGLPTRVVVFTMYDDPAKMKQALAAGAAGYILKNSSPEVLLEELSRIMNGEVVLPKKYEPLKSESGWTPSTSEKPSSETDPLDKLSKREREVFFLLADGLPNRVIAKKLFISPRTVETHRARVIKKLGFSSTADLIRYAIRHNLLTV
ncbi:MAG: response regulator transcription factor [Deltaproteobacteria bacterium]|nr:response regulator transcription factor [Deltaproteobacteria bacterium]